METISAGLHTHLKAEEAYGVDDIVLPVGPRSRKHSWQVVDRQREKEHETQQVAPDIHSLIGQDENTRVERNNKYTLIRQ